MYQGPNFNKGTNETKPARESGIWCPIENLSGFDLAIGDRILFVKTRGASTQQVQPAYHSGTTPKDWLLDEIYVGELVSTIYSRNEYCQRKKIPGNTQLWVKDQKRNHAWRWNRVFEFRHIKTLRSGISMKKLKDTPELIEFVSAVTEAFCYQRSREITLQEYRDLLEYLIPRTGKK